MEKSNSFKRVLAGTLALLTVASSVPAEAGSVIGDFFGAALTAEALPEEATAHTVAVTNVAVNGTSGTAKVSIDGADAVDATVSVATDANNTNLKTLTIKKADTSAFGAAADAVTTVDGYTVVGNATVSGDTLTIKVNTFIARPAEGTTEFEFNGTERSVLFGKKMQGDEGAMAGADGNNTVEIAYMTSAAGSDYVVIPEEELKDAKLFDYKLDGQPKTTFAGTATANVNRATPGDIGSTVTNHIITLTGKPDTKYAGLTFDAKLLITPLDITNKVTVTEKKDANYSIPHVAYKREAVTDTDIITSAVVNDSNIAANGDDATYKLTFEGRTDTEAGQNGVLTDATGKVSDKASDNVNAVNVGLYTATLNYGGNYTGSSRVSFRIMPAELTVAQITGTEPAYDTVNTVKMNDVDKKGTTTDKFSNSTVTDVKYTKVYDRASDCGIIKALGDKDEFGLTLTTYYKAPGDADFGKTAVTDFAKVGTYKTVITVSGNYKASTKDEAAIVWDVTAYDFGADEDERFVDGTVTNGESAWVGFAVNPATGKIEAAFNIRDNIETDPTAQEGVKLVPGTDFTVEYKQNGGEGGYKDTIPEGLTADDKLDVKITGKGNYSTNAATENKNVELRGVKISEYKLTPGATVLNAKVGGVEKVKYQYGDEIKATVEGVPTVLSQESRYIKVELDQNGKPKDATTKANCKGMTQINEWVNNVNNATTAAAKKTAIDTLYTNTIATPTADETEGVGYVVVVFVNRNGGAKPTDSTPNPAYNSGYNSLFDSTVGVSKGITVSKREISDSSKVEIEFVNPLLTYKGGNFTAEELETNIKSIKVDGVALACTETKTGDVVTKREYADFKVEDSGDNAIKEVGNYSIKLNFGDATPATGDNFKGTFKTNAETQKLSVVAAQLTAADFTIDDKAILAVYTKDGKEYVDGYYYKADGTESATAGVGFTQFKYQTAADKDKYTFAYYKAATNPTFDNKEKTRDVKSAKYPAADYQVTGNKQTNAGPYEITISGVKNTKGTVTVKWSIEGNTFAGFTATADKTTFDYNGKGQSPAFTVSKTENNKTTTLTEGKEYAVEYYSGTTKLEGKPQNVGTYTAKIVGINAYYGAEYQDKFTFTIAPSSDLSITITAKKDADFSYNGKNLVDRVNDLFDINVDGKKLDEDADNYIYHIVEATDAAPDARTAKNVGKYKISVTVYDDNYQPKTSAPTDFEITPKEITLSNIKANVKTAVYGAPVAQINDSITFDYTGVLEEDADKVSVADFRGFVVVSNNYRSGSPAGEYTLTYNDKFEPISEAAKNYKAKKFSDTEKITIAKKDLADAKANVSLVVVKSQFANTAPVVAGNAELKANQIVYNGQPYEVYIQKNDNGLMTMADLKLTGSPKALHAADDYEVVAVASANGNYTGTATLNLAWAINQCEIGYDVDVSVAKYSTDTKKLSYLAENNNNEVGTALSVSNKIGSDADVLAGKATYCIATNVSFYTVNDKGNKTYFVNPKTAKAGASVNYYRADNAAATNFASEAAGDYTVYFYQLDDKGQPIESTKTTGYPTTGGNYRATVEFSKDFVLVNSTAPSEDPDFVPKKAEIGYVDFTVKGIGVNAEITDNNGKDFVKTYGDSEEPSFTITFNGSDSTTRGDDLITAKVDVTKMYKVDEKGNYILDNNKNKIPYDGTAGYYDLEGAVVMNDTDYSCNFYRVYNDQNQIIDKFNYKYINNKLVYQVKQSTDYTIQFDHENNVFALKNGKAVAGYQVVDNNSGKVMTEGVDYTLKGSNEVYKTGKYTLFVDGMGNYTGDAHADWVVTSGDTSVDAKLIDSNTVSFKDQVEFNFLAEINDSAYADGAYVKFTYDHYGEKTEVTKYLSKTDMYGKYYRFRLPLTASEMAIDVKADLYLKNSAKPISTKTRSIKDYAEKAIAKNLDGSDVLKAMLNYGGYTQVALGNNTSLLSNASADIKEDVSAIAPKSATTFVKPTPYEGTTTVGLAGIPQSVKIKFTPSVSYKGTTVLTRSKLFVRHYFTVNESMVDKEELAEITVYNPCTGKEVALVSLPKNSTGYYLDMDAEMAYNLDRANGVVKVYNYPGIVTNAESYTAANGQVVAAGAATYKVGAMRLQGDGKHDYADFNDYYVRNADGTITTKNDQLVIGTSNIYAIEVKNYNVIDYCEAIVANAKQTTAAKNMVKALYKYYQAAEAYVAKRS